MEFFGSTKPAPGPGLSPSLSAIQGTNAGLLEHVAALWIEEGDFVVDATYGRGAFWKKVGEPTAKHDLRLDGVSLDDLPYEQGSVDVLVLDPPYRPTHGSKGGTNHGLGASYGVGNPLIQSMDDVIELYRRGIAEAYRVLSPDGRLLVKCQDMSYNHRLHLVSLEILMEAQSSGFIFVDHFVLLNTSRPPIRGKQERARRAHSNLWVLVKEDLI